MSILIAPFARIVRYRAVLAGTALMELRSQYAGSVLGALWIVVAPLLLLAVYATIYLVVFQVRPATMSALDYLLYVSAGLVSFVSFSASLNAGAACLAGNRQILLNTVFPAELLPVRAVLVASVTLVVGVAIVAAARILAGGAGFAMLAAPAFVLLQIMFSCGAAWVLSLLTLVLRDIQHVLQYVAMMLLVVTPIGYMPDMIPGNLRILMYANPLYYFVAPLQETLIHARLPDPELAAGSFAVGVTAFLCGYWLFQKAKTTFYDYA